MLKSFHLHLPLWLFPPTENVSNQFSSSSFPPLFNLDGNIATYPTFKGEVVMSVSHTLQDSLPCVGAASHTLWSSGWTLEEAAICLKGRSSWAAVTRLFFTLKQASIYEELAEILLLAHRSDICSYACVAERTTNSQTLAKNLTVDDLWELLSLSFTLWVNYVWNIVLILMLYSSSLALTLGRLGVLMEALLLSLRNVLPCSLPAWSDFLVSVYLIPYFLLAWRLLIFNL